MSTLQTKVWLYELFNELTISISYNHFYLYYFIYLKTSTFNRELWSKELSPVLQTWKKLNQQSKIINSKLTNPKNVCDLPPVHQFVHSEVNNSIKIVQSVHQTLASLSKVIRGIH